MSGKLKIVGAILLFALGGWAAQPMASPCRDAQAVSAPAETAVVQPKGSPQISPMTGTALLDLFIDNLRDMAQRGSSDAIETRLQEMMVAADKAQEAGKINAVFFRRYNMMLAVTKLVATPDSSGVLAPVIDQVLWEFTRDRVAKDTFLHLRGPMRINLVATALAQEIIDLQIYLDTLGQRQALQRKIEERMAVPPKK